MFEKQKLRKSIKKSKRLIELYEQKRARSQAALVEAILQHTEPQDRDVDYFNQFTELIENERAKLHRLTEELKGM